MRAAETMAEVVKKTTVPPAILERIRPVIAEMAANDKDKDVKYYAAEALKSL